jgi:hypothetical protein
VGNAAKIDAFCSGSTLQPEHEAYLQLLEQRADHLLSGGHFPTPNDIEVAGLEDEYHSDTDDEVYWGEDAGSDDDQGGEEGFLSFGREPATPWGLLRGAVPPPVAQVPSGLFGASPWMPQGAVSPVPLFGSGAVTQQSASSSSDDDEPETRYTHSTTIYQAHQEG